MIYSVAIAAMFICGEAREQSWYSNNDHLENDGIEDGRQLKSRSGGGFGSSTKLKNYSETEDEGEIDDVYGEVYYEDKGDTTISWVVMAIVLGAVVLCIVCYCVATRCSKKKVVVDENGEEIKEGKEGEEGEKKKEGESESESEDREQARKKEKLALKKKKSSNSTMS